MSDRICKLCGGKSDIRCKWRNKEHKIARRLRCRDCRAKWTVTDDFTTIQFYGRRPVMCIESGEVYPSLTAAAKDVFVSVSTINAAVRLGYRAAGKLWRYAEKP